MKAVSIKELKDELTNCSSTGLRDLCLQLARFRKENKELLTYLLFESSDEALYIMNVKQEVDEQFTQINKKESVSYKKKLPENSEDHPKILEVFKKEGNRS